MLNFGNEPGLKSKISVCGPSVRSRRRGAFSGLTRGLHAVQGKPSPTRLGPWPPRFPGPLGHPPRPSPSLKKSIALDQTGYGAIQRVHLGPLNRTFQALYFPGSPLSVENHCFRTLGQSASFRRRYLS